MATFLSIILLILKIIGILLLVLLALFLIILLVPVRYGFELSAPEKEEISAKADVGWLLHLVSGRISYLEKKLNYDIKVLGFRIISNDPDYLKKKKQKNSKKEEKKEPDIPEEKPDISEEKPDIPEEKSDVSEERPDISQEKEDSQNMEIPETIEEYHPTRLDMDEGKESHDQKEEQKPLISERISAAAEKFKGIGNKISEGKDKAENLKNSLEEYQIPELLGIGKDTLLAVLHHILPYYLRGWIQYGFDDPSLTGYAAALGAIFYPRYYKNFSLEPDFQRVCFAGYCKGKGRIRLGFFLIIIIKLLLKKEVRRLLHLLLK